MSSLSLLRTLFPQLRKSSQYGRMLDHVARDLEFDCIANNAEQKWVVDIRNNTLEKFLEILALHDMEITPKISNKYSKNVIKSTRTGKAHYWVELTEDCCYTCLYSHKMNSYMTPELCNELVSLEAHWQTQGDIIYVHEQYAKWLKSKNISVGEKLEASIKQIH